MSSCDVFLKDPEESVLLFDYKEGQYNNKTDIRLSYCNSRKQNPLGTVCLSVPERTICYKDIRPKGSLPVFY